MVQWHRDTQLKATLIGPHGLGDKPGEPTVSSKVRLDSAPLSLYTKTMAVYTLTGDENYLNTARKMGLLWLYRLGQDRNPVGVPQWSVEHLSATNYSLTVIPFRDFDAPAPTSRDTSAAAIASVAFLELSKAEDTKGNSTGSAYWRDNAIRVSNRGENQLWIPTDWLAFFSFLVRSCRTQRSTTSLKIPHGTPSFLMELPIIPVVSRTLVLFMVCYPPAICQPFSRGLTHHSRWLLFCEGR